MTGLREDLAQYTRKPGDPGLPGAGRPHGSKTKLPDLPQIVINKLPFPLVKQKRGDTVEEYWERQAPKTLMYLFKRFNAFIVYQEAGHPDPFGAEVFKLLGKELVKDIRSKAKKARDAGTPTQLGEGAEVKKYKQQLTNMRESFAADAEILDHDVVDGVFKPAEGTHNLMDSMDDEF